MLNNKQQIKFKYYLYEENRKEKLDRAWVSLGARKVTLGGEV